MRKIFAVARYEFVGAVTRLGYLITLVGMPLFMGLLMMISSIVAVSTVTESLAKKKIIGVVDESGLFREAPDSIELQLTALPEDMMRRGPPSTLVRRTELKRFRSLAEAQLDLQAGSVASVVRIPLDYVESGRLEEYVRSKREFDLTAGRSNAASLLRPWLVQGLLKGQVQPALAARAADPSHLERFVLDVGGTAAPADLLREVRPFVVPIAFALLLFISVFTSASYLATGLAEEKQNRALELLLTSLSLDQLFWGKLLGLWCAALLQFVLYLMVVALPAGFFLSSLGLHFSQALVGLCYFVLGFFFFGAVLLMVGAIGNTQKYTQQLSAVVSITAVFPLILVTSVLAQPNGKLALTLTYIPFTAPVTGLLRFGADALPGWEFALSLLVLGASAALVIRLCARIFRVALLATGTTPTPAQLWQWLRTG